MIWLKEVVKKAPKTGEQIPENIYPFNLPLIQKMERLDLNQPITFLVGENGSGKSTLIEAIAEVTQLQKIESENKNKSAKNLAQEFRPVWAVNPHRGFFLTAEDFFGFIKKVHHIKSDLEEQKQDYSQRFSGYGKLLAVGAMEGQTRAIENSYGRLASESHGEGFIDFFQNRLVPDGLYILDEPEAALSPTRQLALISLIKEYVRKNCQFIIATHSPILMAYEAAVIYWLGKDRIDKINYSETEHVALTRNFLNNPEEYLRRL